MNLINKQLQKIKSEKRLGLMTHLVIGYPTLEDTVKLSKVMEESGVDFIELQIPFSDPLADGPTIMKACEESLRNGTRVKDAFKIAKKLSPQISIPLIFMSYYNIVHKYGVEKFCQDAKLSGVSGLIIPDIPIEEEQEEHFFKFCKQYSLANIQVVSPVSTDERLKKNAKIASGFIYCTSRQGITGVKANLNTSLKPYLKRVRNFFPIPIAVGFGISKNDHLRQIRHFADIAVVGSAIIEEINRSNEKLEENIRNFINQLKNGNIHT